MTEPLAFTREMPVRRELWVKRGETTGGFDPHRTRPAELRDLVDLFKQQPELYWQVVGELGGTSKVCIPSALRLHLAGAERSLDELQETAELIYEATACDSLADGVRELRRKAGM